MEIVIPGYWWFQNSIAPKGKSGNIFTGSYGADPLRGSLGKTIMCYNILLKTFDDDSVRYVVNVWYELAWKDGKGKELTETETKEFDDGEESLPLIVDWLKEKAAEKKL